MERGVFLIAFDRLSIEFASTILVFLKQQHKEAVS
jgi:hypothetical protein